MSRIHGIAIREKATKKIEEFYPCNKGREAFNLISSIRHNLNHNDYEAVAITIDESEIPQ